MTVIVVFLAVLETVACSVQAEEHVSVVSVNVTLVSLARPVNVMRVTVSTKSQVCCVLVEDLVVATDVVHVMWSQCLNSLTLDPSISVNVLPTHRTVEILQIER